MQTSVAKRGIGTKESPTSFTYGAVTLAFGMVVGTLVLGIPYDLYVSNTISQLKMSDFLTGLMKAGVFGLLLGLIACYNGLRVTGGESGRSDYNNFFESFTFWFGGPLFERVFLLVLQIHFVLLNWQLI
jgi:hypothetical protein